MSSSEAVASATASAAAGELQVPPQYRAVGVVLAVASGILIGSSFVFKKKGLIQSQAGKEAGVGVDYLKNTLWWFGMTLMIIGEICNFAAYAFTEAIIVTPLGALSVVICAILSSFFLNERLTLFGWIGCFQCIVGSVIIALNGPKEQSVSTIAEFKKLFLAPSFLAFGSVIIVASLIVIFYFAPKYGQKNMLWYILVCSLIGGLSVSCTQGLGASIVTSIRGHNQFKNWFIYFLLAFVVITLLTEIYFLNVALALFNTAMVTPTYYVIFTFCTLATSVILYQGLNSSVTQILTVVLGFLTICSGITLLQMSKVDPTKLEHKLLDRRTTILLKAAKEEVQVPNDDPNKEVEMTEEPGMDALRGTFGIGGTIVRARRRSTIGGGTQSGWYNGSLHTPSSPGARPRRGTVTSNNSSFGHTLSIPTANGHPHPHDLEKAVTAPPHVDHPPPPAAPSSPRYHWFRRTGSGPRKQKLSTNPSLHPPLPTSPARPRSATLETDGAGHALTMNTNFSVPEEDEGVEEMGELSIRTLLQQQQLKEKEKEKEKEMLRRSKSSPQRGSKPLHDDTGTASRPRTRLDPSAAAMEGNNDGKAGFARSSSANDVNGAGGAVPFMLDVTTAFDSPDQITPSESDGKKQGAEGSGPEAKDRSRESHALSSYFDAAAEPRTPSRAGGGGERATFSSEAHLLGTGSTTTGGGGTNSDSSHRYTMDSSMMPLNHDNIPSIIVDSPRSLDYHIFPTTMTASPPTTPSANMPPSSQPSRPPSASSKHR